MKTKSLSQKTSPKDYAEVLFLNTKKIFEEFRLTRRDSPLVVMNASNLAFLSFLSLLLEILTKEKDISFVKKIINEYGQLLKREFPGEIAHIRTATALTEEEKVILNERLASVFGKYFHLDIEIEPELIGGFVITIGDKVLDESVLGRIEELGRYLNVKS